MLELRDKEIKVKFVKRSRDMYMYLPNNMQPQIRHDFENQCKVRKEMAI